MARVDLWRVYFGRVVRFTADETPRMYDEIRDAETGKRQPDAADRNVRLSRRDAERLGFARDRAGAVEFAVRNADEQVVDAAQALDDARVRLSAMLMLQEP